jgi:putative SOS response-associated peptidase YedK
MCGRYVTASSAARLAAAFGAVDRTDGADVVSYNRAPTQPTPAVVLDGDGQRVLLTLRWGLVPSWSKDPRGASRMINARVETALTKPAYRTAVRRRRALLPASGWYEWPARTGRRPVYITVPGGEPFAFAGVHDTWRGPDGTSLRTCAILTTGASTAIGPLHHRMPVLVGPDSWQAWLTRPAGDTEALLAELAAPQHRLEHWPVHPAVGSVHSDGPRLIDPIDSVTHRAAPPAELASRFTVATAAEAAHPSRVAAVNVPAVFHPGQG